MSSDFESLSCDDEQTPPHSPHRTRHSTENNNNNNARLSGSFDSLDDLVAEQDARLLRTLPVRDSHPRYRAATSSHAPSRNYPHHLHDNSDIENNTDEDDDPAAAYGHREFGVTGQPPTNTHPPSHSLLGGFVLPRDRASAVANTTTTAAPPPNVRQPTAVHRKTPMDSSCGQDRRGDGKAKVTNNAHEGDDDEDDGSLRWKQSCKDRSAGASNGAKGEVRLFTARPKQSPDLPPPPQQQQRDVDLPGEAHTSRLPPTVVVSGTPPLTFRHPSCTVPISMESTDDDDDGDEEDGSRDPCLGDGTASATQVAVEDVAEGERRRGMEAGAQLFFDPPRPKYRTAASVDTDATTPSAHQRFQLYRRHHHPSSPTLMQGSCEGSDKFAAVAAPGQLLPPPQQQHEEGGGERGPSHPSQTWRATCPPDSGQITPVTSAATLTASATTRVSVTTGETEESEGTPETSRAAKTTQPRRSQPQMLSKPATASTTDSDRTRDEDSNTGRGTTNEGIHDAPELTGRAHLSSSELKQVDALLSLPPSPPPAVQHGAVAVPGEQQQQQQKSQRDLVAATAKAYHDADGFYRTGLLEASTESDAEEDVDVNPQEQSDASAITPASAKPTVKSSHPHVPFQQRQQTGGQLVDASARTAEAAARATTTRAQAGDLLLQQEQQQQFPVAAPSSSSLPSVPVGLGEKLRVAVEELHRAAVALPPVTTVHLLTLVITVLVPLNVLCLDLMAFAWIRRRVDARYRPTLHEVCETTCSRNGTTVRYNTTNTSASALLPLATSASVDVKGRHIFGCGGAASTQPPCARSYAQATVQGQESVPGSLRAGDENSSNTTLLRNGHRVGRRSSADVGSPPLSLVPGGATTHVVPAMCAFVLWMMIPNGLLVRLFLLSRASLSVEETTDLSSSSLKETPAAAAATAADSDKEGDTVLMETVNELAVAVGLLYSQLRTRAPQVAVMELYVRYACWWIMVHAVLPAALRAAALLDGWMPVKDHDFSLTPQSASKSVRAQG